MILSLSVMGRLSEKVMARSCAEWQGLLPLNFDVADSKAPIGADLLEH